MVEVGYFDTYPFSNDIIGGGAWSIFPYFRSGLVAISSIGEVLFLVKPNLDDDESDDCSDQSLQYQNQKRKNSQALRQGKMQKGMNESKALGVLYGNLREGRTREMQTGKVKYKVSGTCEINETVNCAQLKNSFFKDVITRE
jgi:hypothetical protein